MKPGIGRIGIGLAVLALAAAASAQEPPPDKTPRGGDGKLADGLVFHCDFSKVGSGTAVRDASGAGNDGTAEKELEFVPGMGRRKKAVHFGGGNFVRVPRSESLEPDELTVAVWMRVPGEGEGSEPGAREPFSIVFKRNSAFHWNEDYSLECYPNRVVRITVGNPGARQIRVDSRVALAPDLWHHVAMVLRRGSVSLYFDGEEVGAGDCPFPLDHNAQADLLIGARDHASYPMDRFARCDFADVRIWNKPLDAGQIFRLYQERSAVRGVAGPQQNPKPARPDFPFEPPTSPRPQPNAQDRHPRPRPKPVPAAPVATSVPPPLAQPAPPPAATLQDELRLLVRRGRRTHSATPEFLDAIEAAIVRHPASGVAAPVPPPSGKLPLRPSFDGPGIPAGWSAIMPDVWRIGGGVADQFRSWANTRFLLFYEPGMEWTDYELSFRFESDGWLVPPANSAACIYFRYRSLEDALGLAIDGAGFMSLVSLDKGCNGQLRPHIQIPLDKAIVRDGKPWRVRLTGSQIEVFHEGVRYLLATDASHPAGTVGFEAVHIPVRFSGISVEPLSAPRWR